MFSIIRNLVTYFATLIAAVFLISSAHAQFDTDVDAAMYANGKSYFFVGNKYYRLNGSAAEGGYPKPLSEWKNLPEEFLSGIDAALYQPEKNRIYLFKGSEYVRIKGITVEEGYPANIRQWRNLPTDFQAGIDAAIFRGGYTYFFKGNRYVRIKDITVQNGYPANISVGWKLPASYLERGVSAAFHHPTRNKNYFFQGSTYARLTDVNTDSGYPKDISENWPGVEIERQLFDDLEDIGILSSVDGLKNVMFAGAEISVTTLSTTNLSACEALCAKESECTAYTLAPPGGSSQSAQCRLKKGTVQAKLAHGYLSGIRDRRPASLNETSLLNKYKVSGAPYNSTILSLANPLACSKQCESDASCQFFSMDMSGNEINPTCELYKAGQISPTKANVISGYKPPTSGAEVAKNLLSYPGDIDEGLCSNGIIMDVVSKICEQIPAFDCVDEDNNGRKSRNTCTNKKLLTPVGAVVKAVKFSDNTGAKLPIDELKLADGKRLTDAAMCSLRELSPGLKTGNSTGPVVNTNSAGGFEYNQTLGYLNFDPESRIFDGYRHMEFCAPIVGCFNTATQKLRIQQKSVPLNPRLFLNNNPLIAKGSGLSSAEPAIAEYFVLETKAESIDQIINMEWADPKIFITTNFGTIEVKPTLSYENNSAVIDPEYFSREETTRVPNNLVIANAYGIDDALAFPFLDVSADGWRSQIAYGNRDPGMTTSFWSGAGTRPDLSLNVARTEAEKRASVAVSSSAVVSYPEEAKYLKELPPGLQVVNIEKFQIFVEPKVRAAFSGQFNVVNTSTPYKLGEDNSNSKAFKGELQMQTGAAHAFGFSFTTGFDLVVYLSPFDVKIIDVSPRWTIFDVEPVAGNAPVKANHSAKFSARDGFTGFKTFKTSVPAAQADAYLQQCLAEDAKDDYEGALPEPEVHGQNLEEMFDNMPVPCNICVFHDGQNNGTLEAVNRPAGAKGWACDAPEKSGCFDMCRLNRKTGTLTYDRPPDAGLMIPDIVKGTRRTGEVCHQTGYIK